ncbi:MAG: PhnD/SsuA/transferrin family substrate-binding protein, partial [Pseudomonadota bacterium]
NSAVSQSGWAAIDDMAGADEFAFTNIVETGAHAKSALAVADGTCDICAVDAVTWQMIERWDAFAADLKVLATTAHTPALPFITAGGRDPRPLQEALVRAVDALSEEDRVALCLMDVTHISADEYAALPIPPTPKFSTVI